MDSLRLVGSLDQGTTSTRFLVFDHRRNIVAKCQVEHAQITPCPGWLQHNPNEIAENAVTCIRAAIKDLRSAHGQAATISALGITNQRETTIAWSAKTGEPLYDAIVWSDARTADIVQDVSQGDTNFAREICGLPCSTYFSAVKMKWMLDNVPAVREASLSGTLRFGTMDSWLIYKLSGGTVHVTDCTNASRTMLMNLRTLQWSNELCDRFGIPPQSLPRIISCSEHITLFSPGNAHPPIPITGCIGDQQGALVGQLCLKPGMAKNTYGTGCFFLMNAGADLPPASKAGLLTTVAFKMSQGPCVYAVEGSIAGAGSAVQWLRDRLGVIKNASDTAQLASSVDNSGGVVFVPAFSGLLAPYWDPDARGTILGITQQTTSAHIVRAVLDAIAQQVTELVEATERETGITVSSLSVDGGMANNHVLMQIQADSLGKEVSVPAMLETTAAGAAICASLINKLWGDLDDMRPQVGHILVEPRDNGDSRTRRRKLWKAAVKRSIGWAKL